ncbi:MAG: YdcF family protein [Christensenellaceae bacterium]|nr:YdcF family protein [Christensenellaceae bacterium]
MLMLLVALALACAVVYVGLVAMVFWRAGNVPPAGDYDAIIVLGAQVNPNGEPSIQLRWRLDAAVEAWQETNTMIVACGAQGGNEPAPEAQVMRDYLVARGVAEEDILIDTDSYNTRQNIRNAAGLLAGYNVERVLIVTSDYHLPRAMALAEDEGLDATGVGSPTKEGLLFKAKNYGREALAWVKYWAQKYLRLPLG